MPGMYADGEYDIAGTIVGAVEKSRIMTGAKVRKGDALLALPSTGYIRMAIHWHGNCCSMLRGLKVDSLLPDSGTVLGDELLKVHRSYLKAITALVRKQSISAAAHITGGGITDNLPRVLPKGLAAAIRTGSWQVPPLFEMLRSIGNDTARRLAPHLQSGCRHDSCYSQGKKWTPRSGH